MIRTTTTAKRKFWIYLFENTKSKINAFYSFVDLKLQVFIIKLKFIIILPYYTVHNVHISTVQIRVDKV